MHAKEQEGRMQNPMGRFSVPWWRSLGSQYRHGEDHDDQLKSLCMDHNDMEAGQAKGSASHSRISCGSEQKTPHLWAAVSEQSAMPESHPHIGLACTQQMYLHLDQCCGLFSTYGPQAAGRLMLPISKTPDEGPIYVNAKQYHGIMRRRKSRAKAELENRILKIRKPYLHESRHLHALRRARGTGGRFLGTKDSEAEMPGEGTQNPKNGQQVAHPTSSLKLKDTNAGRSLTLSGSEVTSTCPRVEFGFFNINCPLRSVCSLANAIGADDRMVSPLKWCPEARDHCNLKV